MKSATTFNLMGSGFILNSFDLILITGLIINQFKSFSILKTFVFCKVLWMLTVYTDFYNLQYIYFNKFCKT